MSHVLRIGVPDQIAYFRAFNDDGSAKTDFTSATAGASLSAFRIGLSPISIAVLSDKAADNTSHADGAIRNVGGNLYTVDLPDSASASYCPSIGVRGSFTGGVIEPIPHPLVGYAPETLLNDIFGLVEDVAVLAKSTASSGTIFQVQIDSPSGVFASHPALQDCLLEIKDVSSGVTCYRWITTHAGIGGDGGVVLYFETPTPFLPAAGDLLRVFRAARFTSNVNKWLGSSPGVLVGNRVPAYDADAQTLLGDIPTVAEFNARTLPAADYFDPATDGVKVTGIGTATVSVDGGNVSFPTAIGTSNLSPFNVATVLFDNNIVTTSQLNARTLVAAEYATAAALTNVQGRLPAALVGGKMSSHIATEDRVGYALDSGYQAGLVAAIDAGLLNAGDATDLIASIVSRIGNTNVDEASLVAAIKASLFSAGSIANKLSVDGTGRVTVGTNGDKTGYSLAADQAVNVTKVGGTAVSGPNDLKADLTGLALEATAQSIKGKTDSLTFTVAGILDTNLQRWRGTQPGTLDSNGFVGSNVAAINGNLAAVATLRTALDNNYFSKLNVSGTLAHTNNAASFKADVGSLALETSVQAVGLLVESLLAVGSTDWTADERAAIRDVLGIPVSGTVPVAPSTGVLSVIADKASNLPELPAMLAAIGQQDHRPYEQDEGSIGWTARKLQSGASPGIPRAF